MNVKSSRPKFLVIMLFGTLLISFFVAYISIQNVLGPKENVLALPQ